MPARVVPVTAVLVAHDGSRWLPEVLAALDSQTVRPARVVAVDTGSSDDCAALLRRTTGGVLELPRTTGYPAAVAAALATVPADTRWIWLLHDDSAPAPDALESLLRHAASSPSAAVLGPKVVDWSDTRVLVEVGLTVDAVGSRDPGVEPGELDQGQHDAPRDVLAVGTAGALVRREVWDAVGGLDPALPLFRHDLDLGWRVNAAGHRVVVVPRARLRHARAATTGRRAPDAVRGSAAAADRRAALRVLLAHAAGWRLALTLPWLVVVGLLRAVGFLLRRAPGEAYDELSALLAVLSRPDRVLVARRSAAATRTVPPAALRPLRPALSTRLRARLAALVDRPPAAAPGPADSTGLRRLTGRPGVLLVLALLVVTLVAERALLGGGLLLGGRLLPAPESAADLWSAYTASWSGSSVGSDDPAPPLLALLALPATLLLGSAPLAVDLLVLGSVPLAGAVAFAAAGRLVQNPLLRAWAAATWALLPVATGAVAAGRLGAAVAHVALPALLVGAHAVVTGDPRRQGWAPAWRLGLALAATVAFAPLLWPLAALLLLGTGLLAVLAVSPPQRPAARRRALAAALAAGVPAALLLPWSFALLSSPRDLLHGLGRLSDELVEPVLPAEHLLLLSPGGPGLPALGVTAGLLLAALGGLLRTRGARTAAAGWGLALVGLAAALALSRTPVAGLPVWPGVPLDLAAAGMLLAALVAARDLRGGLGRSAFGWRQLVAVLVVVAAAAVPVLCAAGWVLRGADDPLRRGEATPLPPFALAELAAATGLRALLLTERPDGTVGYTLTGPQGPRLGDAATRPEPEQRQLLDEAVGELLAPRGTRPVSELATRAVRFVALTGDPGGPVATALDAQPGLAREPGQPLWRVLPATSRLVVLDPRGSRTVVDRAVPPGPSGRLLVLAEAADDGWRAELDGRPLAPRTAHGWAQAFALPSEGGDLDVRHESSRPDLLATQAVCLIVALVLAGPGRLRRSGLEVQA
jgi:GT2 family glycosyltransferase